MKLGELIEILKKNNTLEEIKNILTNYDSEDYKEFVEFTEKTYNRVKLYSSPEFDIILICWDKGQFTKIHDHPDYCCAVKLLEGLLLEENFSVHDDKLKVFNNIIIKPNYITTKCSNKIVHRIIPLDKSVSLHIYIPGQYKPNIYE